MEYGAVWYAQDWESWETKTSNGKTSKVCGVCVPICDTHCIACFRWCSYSLASVSRQRDSQRANQVCTGHPNREICVCERQRKRATSARRKVAVTQR